MEVATTVNEVTMAAFKSKSLSGFEVGDRHKGLLLREADWIHFQRGIASQQKERRTLQFVSATSRLCLKGMGLPLSRRNLAPRVQNP